MYWFFQDFIPFRFGPSHLAFRSKSRFLDFRSIHVGIWTYIIKPFDGYHFPPSGFRPNGNRHAIKNCLLLPYLQKSMLIRWETMIFYFRYAFEFMNMFPQILRLSCTSSNETTQGKIINLMSNDVARFDRVFIFLHYIWIMPIQVAIITYMIWRNVQVAALTGVFFIAVQAIPIQGWLSIHAWLFEFHAN